MQPTSRKDVLSLAAQSADAEECKSIVRIPWININLIENGMKRDEEENKGGGSYEDLY